MLDKSALSVGNCQSDMLLRLTHDNTSRRLITLYTNLETLYSLTISGFAVVLPGVGQHKNRRGLTMWISASIIRIGPEAHIIKEVRKWQM